MIFQPNDLTLERVQRKLRRLYELYADAEDDTLRDSIERVKKERERAEQALSAAQRQEQRQEDEEARRALYTIGACWDSLAGEERQALIRACVEKIVLQNGKAEIYYAIEGVSGYETAAG